MSPAAGARSRTATFLALAALLLGTLVPVLMTHAPAEGAEPSRAQRPYAPGIGPTLAADATVSGAVLGPDGAPRDNVLVEALSVLDPAGGPVASDLTYEVGDIASHGAYTLHVPAGDYLVRYSSPEGSAPAVEPTFYGGGSGTTVTVAAQQKLLLDPVTVQRDRGVPVTGRVVDAGGQPLADAEVSLVRVLGDDDYSWRDWTLTDDNGTYTFDAVPRGRAFTISAEGGYDTGDEPRELPSTWLGGVASPYTAESFSLGSRSTGHDLGDLVLRDGVAITGSVTTPTGLGDGADVALVHLNAAGDDGVVVAWDWVPEEADSFRFSALPGHYTVGVLSYGPYDTGDWVFLGDTRDLSKARTFTISDAPYDAGNITIGAESSAVTFEVVDRQGQPADGWYLQPYLLDREGELMSAATDLGDGRFRARVRWDTEFTVGVYDEDWDEWLYLGDTTSFGSARFLTATSQTPAVDAGVVSFATATPAEPAPTSPAPQLRGAPRNGQTLTVAPPDWSLPEVTSSYQWLRDGAPISGATSASYLLATADVGHRVSARVTGYAWRRAHGVTTSSSALIGAGVAPVARQRPAISGIFDPNGGVVHLAPVTWNVPGVTTRLQWYSDGRVIPGATGTSLRLGYRDAGATLKVVATGSLRGFDSGITTSRMVRVGPATPRLRLTGRGAKIRLRVTVPGGLPTTGRVSIYRGRKIVARTRLTARQRGVTIIDLSRLGRGRHRVEAWYSGNDHVAVDRTGPVTVRVP